MERSYNCFGAAGCPNCPVLTAFSMFFPSSICCVFPDPVTLPVPEILPLSVSISVSPFACNLDLDPVTAIAPVLVSLGVTVSVSDPQEFIIPVCTPVFVCNSAPVFYPVLTSDQNSASFSVSDPKGATICNLTPDSAIVKVPVSVPIFV